MQFWLVAVGRLRPPLREVCDDYLRRFRRFAPLCEREVREAGRAGTEALQCEREGGRLLAALPEAAEVVLLELRGTPWSSEQLARGVAEWRRAARDCAFVIGGACGVSPGVQARATRSWSLGPITLPHELARVVVAEQLYRAATILRNEPYHRRTG